MRWTSTTEVVANDDDGTMPGLYQLLATVGIVQAAPMIRPDWPKLAADAAVAAGLDPEVFDDMPDCPEPEVIADADVEYEPDVLVPPTIYFAGGGPSTPDHEYDRVLSAALEPLATSEEWAQWWAAGNQPPCEIWYWIGGPSTQIRIHRNDRRVAVRIKRAADQAHPDDLNPDPGADAARIDAESVITKLRDRFGLGPPPALIAPATKIQSRRLP